MKKNDIVNLFWKKGINLSKLGVLTAFIGHKFQKHDDVNCMATAFRDFPPAW